VPVNASWYPDLLSELLRFPAGKHDDQVDALGLLGQLLDQMTSGRPVKKPDPDTRDAYRSAQDEFDEMSGFDKSL
jgi:hypothetical protein